MSGCGLAGGESCRWCVTPSSYLGMFIGVLCLVLSITCYAEKSDVYDELNTKGIELGLTTDEINEIKSWYVYIGPILFIIFLLEVMRFRASRYYRNNISKLDNEFETLLEEDDKAYTEKLNYNSNIRENKYDTLRQHYKNKYQAPSPSENEAEVGTGKKFNRGSSGGAELV